MVPVALLFASPVVSPFVLRFEVLPVPQVVMSLVAQVPVVLLPTTASIFLGSFV